MYPVNTVRCWSGGGPQNKIWNWGDAISPTLFTLISGEPATILDYTDLTDEPHLVMCGSTLKWITAGSIVWGTGQIAARMEFMAGSVRPLDVAATRGPLTRASLEALGILSPAIYGDPALLFPHFYCPNVEVGFELGVIPHYIDTDLPFLKGLEDHEDVQIIDVTRAVNTEKVYSFIDDVLRCKRIVSSSLHGLIIAEAYGVPAIWAQFSNGVFGDGFKFRDYYLSVGRDLDRVASFGLFNDVRDAIAAVDRSHATLGPIDFNPEPLLGTFPGRRIPAEEQ